MPGSIRILVLLTLFATAMAQVEAALVVHLRSIYYPADPLSLFPMALLSPRDLRIELVRELATVVMILGVALLAARGAVRVFAAFVYVFGLWDILYYAWLKIMIGWPTAWLEWDVLFLIPWPWLGPWITPALIALLFVIWGGRVIAGATEPVFPVPAMALFTLGALAGLAAFLLPALPLLAAGDEAFLSYMPGRFPWMIYSVGLGLMMLGLLLSSLRTENNKP
jgi:hypothetical protein